jgi:hypothetical protein
MLDGDRLAGLEVAHRQHWHEGSWFHAAPVTGFDKWGTSDRIQRLNAAERMRR